jgi:hypothetical protein
MSLASDVYLTAEGDAWSMGGAGVMAWKGLKPPLSPFPTGAVREQIAPEQRTGSGWSSSAKYRARARARAQTLCR